MKIKKISVLAFATALLLLSACGNEQMSSTLAGKSPTSGGHFQLNIIGVPKSKTASITSGNRIFIPLEGRSKVLLSEGEFAVIDGNGTDGSAAFRLPAPDADGDGVTTYSVYAKAVGKPGGSVSVNTCATEPSLNTEICSLETLVSTRTKGKSTFTNVSNELLSISADIDGDGTTERVPLFDDRLKDYLWNFDNNGLKVLQLRFVEKPTTAKP